GAANNFEAASLPATRSPREGGCEARRGRVCPSIAARLTETRVQNYNPLLDKGAAMCSSERLSAATPIHASTIAPKIISAAARRYPRNNAVIDPEPMIHPKRTGAPTPPASVPTA